MPSTIIVIIILLLVFGGGGFFISPVSGGVGLSTIIAILLILWLLGII